MLRSWIPLTVTLSIQALVSVAALTLPVLAPAVAPALGVSPALVGVYVAIMFIGATLSTLGGGSAVARYGTIRVSQAGLVLSAAGLLLCAFPSWPSMAAGAFLIGLGYGPMTPASSHLLARTTAPNRLSLVFSVKQTGVPLGGVIAGAVVPGLSLAVGWQAAVVLVALANLACAVAAQPLRADLDADRNPAAPLTLSNLARTLGLVLRHPVLRLLAACSFVFSLTQNSFSSYLVTFLEDALAYGLVAAGAALALAQLAGVAGRIVWGWVADRWLGAQRMLAGLALLMAASAASTALLQPWLPAGLVSLVLVVFGASAIGWNGVFLAEVARQAPPGQASLATGGTLAFTFFGVVIGPPIFGAVALLTGSYRASFWGLAILTGLCALVLLRVVWRPSAAQPWPG
jgi:predicted MFS family arabinose efflux permease